MSILAQLPTTDNTDLNEYERWLQDIGPDGRRLLLSVTPGATRFICTRTGLSYDDPRPRVVSGTAWARCHWCDAYRRVRGQNAGYDAGTPQFHAYEIQEADHD